MTASIRRIVTGHDEAGRAIVSIDGIVSNTASPRPGQSTAQVWRSDVIPPDNSDPADGGALPIGRAAAAFRVTTFEPGILPRHHRTNSLDLAVVISGELEMEMEETIVRLKPGDCLVQRGTVHNWVNRGPENCVVAFFVLAADPVRVGDMVLEAMG